MTPDVGNKHSPLLLIYLLDNIYLLRFFQMPVTLLSNEKTAGTKKIYLTQDVNNLEGRTHNNMSAIDKRNLSQRISCD